MEESFDTATLLPEAATAACRIDAGFHGCCAIAQQLRAIAARYFWLPNVAVFVAWARIDRSAGVGFGLLNFSRATLSLAEIA